MVAFSALAFISSSESGVTRSALGAHFSRHLLAAELTLVVTTLIDAGLVKTFTAPSRGQGRPATWYIATKAEA